MSSPDAEQLEPILLNGSTEDLRTFMHGKTEADKRQLAKTALSVYRRARPSVEPSPLSNVPTHVPPITGIIMVPVGLSLQWPLGERCFDLALNAALITGSEIQLKTVILEVDGIQLQQDPLDYELLREHSNQSLQLWAEQYLMNHRYYYRLFWKLCDAGACIRPFTPEYSNALFTHAYQLADGIAFKDFFREDQHFLDYDLWNIFQLHWWDGRQLAELDMADGSWRRACVELAHEGILPKEQLLDTCLEKILTADKPSSARYYIRFHDALAPSSAQMFDRLEIYGRILGSAQSQSATFASKTLVEFDKVQPISTEFALKYLLLTLANQNKSSVTNALRLLDRACQREPGSADTLCTAACRVMLNESSDLQSQFVAVLQKHASSKCEKLRAELAQYLDTAAPSVRGKLEKWLASNSHHTLETSSNGHTLRVDNLADSS